jgi:hypothetical protein
MRQAEKELAAQAQASYERMVRDWKAASPKKNVGASVDDHDDDPARAKSGQNQADRGRRRSSRSQEPF